MKRTQARMFYELPSRGRGEGCATGQPQGVGSEAYLNSTSQGPTPEDARKYGHIIRARCASVFAKASTRQAAQSRKRVPNFAVTVTPGREFMKHPG